MRRWTVADVMTRDVASVAPDASYREIVDLLIDCEVRAVPVVDADGRVVGIVSEADLLRDVEVVGQHATLATGQATADAAVAAALMTAPAVTATRETSVVAAARRLEAKRIKRMPVVDGEGRLVGIVSRRDLLRMHTRSDSEIRTDVVDNVLRRSLHLDPLTVQVDVVNGVVTLSGRVESNSVARLVVRLTAEVAGVADVVDRISWRYDDFMVSTGPTHQHAGRGF
jgi:CBS-domain-containing membrane protein